MTPEELDRDGEERAMALLTLFFASTPENPMSAHEMSTALGAFGPLADIPNYVSLIAGLLRTSAVLVEMLAADSGLPPEAILQVMGMARLEVE